MVRSFFVVVILEPVKPGQEQMDTIITDEELIHNWQLNVQITLYLLLYLQVMGNSKPIVLPKLQLLMDQVGEQIRLARLRRRLSADQLAERTGISRRTIYSIEKGSSSVSIGYYLNVLKVLGLEKDILKLASDDELGRKLQDAGLATKDRAPKKK